MSALEQKKTCQIVELFKEKKPVGYKWVLIVNNKDKWNPREIQSSIYS